MRSRADVIDHVQKSLGAPIVCVELDSSHYEEVVDDTEMWLTAFFPRVETRMLELTGAVEYNVDPDVEEITEVIFPESAYGNVIEPYDGDPFKVNASPVYRGPLPNSNVIQRLQMAGLANRTLSLDPEFIWSSDTRKLVIRPDTITGTAMYSFTSRSFDYERLSNAQVWIMRRYAVARGKQILGEIRSKFSEIPTADGRISLNGADLLSQASEEMMILDEKVKLLARRSPFLHG